MVWVENASPAVDAASQYHTIIAVCIVMTVFMASIVSLRLYVRLHMLKVMGLDDWIIMASAIFSIVYNGLCIGQSKWGLGLPISLRPAVNLNQYSVINFAGRPFYMFGILGFKVALCIAYLRVLSYGQRNYRLVVWGVMIGCISGHVAGTLVLIFQCSPVQKSWLPETPGACLPNAATFYGLAAITIVFDVIIFLLPVRLLLGLQINNRRKAALIGVFVLGLFTTVCSILRMVQIIQISKDGNSTLLVLWGTIEMNVGISLTCIPTLAPLFKYFREKNSSHNGNNGRQYPSNAHELLSGNGLSSKIAGPTKSHNAESTDSDSQKGILVSESQLDSRFGSTGIQKTVEVNVRVDEEGVTDDGEGGGRGGGKRSGKNVGW